ncbi:MAG: ABC transporter permease [Candidatus Caldatribacterium sp.]|uniref:ABC transporter permease n=1 Tax=Candidatus Caldatribacterium sp. TaxID=2282143 RepID=UPI00299C6300|nr:ABC transporter permease [Candidatus Caldatribacterium sp.]MCX7730594.1 ABC transporter permease [Candidatus Caldatribacterium sp.]MDW8081636.1 ABC transporter permease [Candidatus Calescibacterium sp.]
MEVLRDLFQDYRFTAAFAICCVLLFLVALSFLSPYDPQRMYQTPRGRPPSFRHLLGTTWLGQDVFWQLTFAVRNSLLIALVASFVSRLIATLVGMVAGYKGGVTDRILMSLGDTTLVLPSLVVFILFSVILRDWVKNFVNLGLLLAFFAWAWDARVIRSQVLSLRERDFTFVAQLSGTRTLGLVTKEYLPFLFPIIFTTFINNMHWAIGMEIFLAYLGLGIDPTVPTIGTMLQAAIYRQAFFLGLWWWLITPIALALLVFIALYWLSSSLSEYLDPRTRIQRIGLQE